MKTGRYFTLGLLLALGCSPPNESGHVRATRIGAVADIPAQRVSGVSASLTATCGPGGAMPGITTLIRYPYLQQVTGRSAQVLWGSEDPAGYTVDVAVADGDAVGSFAARVDETGAVYGGGYQLLAELTGLEPDRVYCYAIHDGQGREILAPTGLHTAPEPGAPISFVAFGDAGAGGADQQSVIAQLQTVPADLMIVTGDLAYDSGTLHEFEDNFFAMYEPMLASVPLFPTSGNHDYHTSDAAPYRAVFSVPENGGEAGRERWYSFDFGDVHFVALDTEKIGDAQARWLEDDLSRNELPWTIAFGHKGPYSSGTHGSNTAFRTAFSPILAAHGVQLVLSGHDHDYERSRPIDGVTYVVTGAGGKGTRPVGSSSFTEFSLDVLHFVFVRVDGDDLRLYAIDATGQEFDFAHIVRAAPQAT